MVLLSCLFVLWVCGEAGGALVLFVCTLGMWRGWWCSCPVCLYFGYVERPVVLLSCLFVLWVCGEAGGALVLFVCILSLIKKKK